jgi:hypothetical protein
VRVEAMAGECGAGPAGAVRESKLAG